MECLRVFAEEYGLQITETPRVVVENADITLTLDTPQLDPHFGINQKFVLRGYRTTPHREFIALHNIVGIEVTGQNNAEGQVFRAKADQPAFVAWTAGVCCRMTRRINVPH